MRNNRKRIMIVDDEPDFRDLLTIILRQKGFETETAKNGLDFLNKVDSFKPNLVTLEIMMSGPKTKEILEKLKAKESNPKIILLTVIRLTDDEKKELIKISNVVDYITKPPELNDFLDSVKKHV